MKIEKVLAKILACMSVLKIQACSRKKSKSKNKQIGGKINIRYVPIYLWQGLVVLSLTSETFLLLYLLLFGLSWRSG
jgi:hypothetical protein